MTEHIEFTINIRLSGIEALIDRLRGENAPTFSTADRILELEEMGVVTLTDEPEPEPEPEPKKRKPRKPKPEPAPEPQPAPEPEVVAPNAEELNALNALLSELGFNLTSPFFREADENFRKHYPGHPIDQNYRDYIRDFLNGKPKLDVPTNWEHELNVFRVKVLAGKTEAEHRFMGAGNTFMARLKNFFVDNGLAYLQPKRPDAEYHAFLEAMELEGKNPKALLDEALEYASRFN